MIIDNCSLIIDIKAIHQFRNMPYIYIYRTVSHTAPAAGALNPIVIFIYIIFKLVHKALSDALKLVAPWIMSRPFKGKEGEHAGIPVSDPVCLLP